MIYFLTVFIATGFFSESWFDLASCYQPYGYSSGDTMLDFSLFGELHYGEVIPADLILSIAITIHESIQLQKNRAKATIDNQPVFQFYLWLFIFQVSLGLRVHVLMH